MSTHPSETGATTTTNPGRGFTITGFILAAAGLLIVPIILGPAGAIFGGVGLSKGDSLGKWAIAAGVLATIIGMALGAWVLSNANS